MSNLVIDVWHQGVVIGHCMYQGSSNTTHTAVFPTYEALDRVWRTPETWRECKCADRELIQVGLAEHQDEEPLSYENDMCDRCKTLIFYNEDE